MYIHHNQHKMPRKHYLNYSHSGIPSCLDKLCQDGAVKHIQCIATTGDRIAGVQGSRDLVRYVRERGAVPCVMIAICLEARYEIEL